MLSRGLLTAIATVAVVAAVAGVLILRGGPDQGSDRAGASGATGDPALVALLAGLAFYDWEPNVIGPAGVPAPADRSVTGGSDAGDAGSLTLYEAVLRAQRRPASAEPDNGRTASLFYAVDRERRRVFGRGEPSPALALASVPAARRAAATVHEVNPDTAIVRAELSPDRWFVIKDDVAIRGSEIRAPRPAADPVSRRPVIRFEFSEPGHARFQQLTEAIALRGAASSLRRIDDDPARHNQHFAVVLDGRIVATPFVDFRRHPDGIDARGGSQLAAWPP